MYYPSLVIAIAMVVAVSVISGVSSCPVQCHCPSPDTVTCSDANLGGIIPADIPRRVKYLELVRSNIGDEIASDAFRGLPLRRLVISRCNVLRIQAFALRGLTNLELVSIRYNPITSLGKYSISGLSNVTELNLGDNRISVIHTDAFSVTENVNTLVLTGNPVESIKTGAFNQLHKVQFFHHSLPHLRHLEPYAFSGLTDVHSLHLKNIQLSSLQEFAFRDLVNVTYLILSNVNIARVHSNAFNGLRSVRNFVIRNSNMTVISRHAFNGLIDVSSVSIKDNTIGRLEEEVFGRTSVNVSSIIVRGNYIKSITGDTFTRSLHDLGYKATGVVDLRDNYFYCACHLRWIVTGYENSALPLASNRCYGALPLQGLLLSEVRRQEIEEDCPTSAAALTTYTSMDLFMVVHSLTTVGTICRYSTIK